MIWLIDGMNRHDPGIEGIGNLPDIGIMTGLIRDHLPPFGLLLLVLTRRSDRGDCADSELQMDGSAKMLFQGGADAIFNGLVEHLGMTGLQHQPEPIALPLGQDAIHRNLFRDAG